MNQPIEPLILDQGIEGSNPSSPANFSSIGRTPTPSRPTGDPGPWLSRWLSNDDEAKARERADSIRRRSPAFRDAFLLGYMRQAVDLSLATKDPAEARRQLALDARTVDLAQESDAIEVVNTLRAYTQQQIDDGAVEPETDR